MIYFIAAVYNEEAEIIDLLHHVSDYVDHIYIADDDSVDQTLDLLRGWKSWYKNLDYITLQHTGLPETVKNTALRMVPEDDAWVLMLDADERFITPISEIVGFLESPACKELDYIYFDQYEIIDGIHVRTFQKCKLFRKRAITFPTGIHEDDQFEGKGEYFKWQVAHRKSSDKQKTREKEYLVTYKKLLDEGKIDEGRYEWLKGLHHYER